MASRFSETDPVRCWDLLYMVLRNEFIYSKSPQSYFIKATGGFYPYNSYVSEEDLLDSIAFELIEGGMTEVDLCLRGKEDGPIYDYWTFTFTLKGLIEANHYYNTD